MVEWVKDVDSGELFPVYNVRELDIPEHLKEVEVTEVDYDKTREKTILQLQEELTEAQERIKLMKATRYNENCLYNSCCYCCACYRLVYGRFYKRYTV